MNKLASALITLAALAAPAHAQISVVDLTTSNGGFTTQSLQGNLNPWQWQNGKGWFNAGTTSPSLQRLLTPMLTATESAWGLVLQHSNIFENGFDGGQVYMSVNGGVFALVGVLTNPYECTLPVSFSSPRGDQPAFCGTDASRASTFSGAANVGDMYQFAFDMASDQLIDAAGDDWTITGITYRDFNVSTVPEPSTWALMMAGLAAVGMAANRRARIT
jgi:hypothetical protein